MVIIEWRHLRRQYKSVCDHIPELKHSMTGLPSWTVLEAHVYVLLSPWRLPPGLSVEYFIKVGSPQSAEMSVQIVYHERKQ